MDLKKFQELRTRSEELQREQSKAEGALEQLKKELKAEFGVDTIKGAKQLLVQLEKEEREAEEEFKQALEAFEAEFGELLT